MDQTQTYLSPEPGFKTACGGKIKDSSKYPSAGYRGERIYFCTQACLEIFLSNPDPFMAGEVEHPVEEDDGEYFDGSSALSILSGSGNPEPVSYIRKKAYTGMR